MSNTGTAGPGASLPKLMHLRRLDGGKKIDLAVHVNLTPGSDEDLTARLYEIPGTSEVLRG
jgi:hypothetical protein